MKKVITSICIIFIVLISIGSMQTSYAQEENGLVLIVVNKLNFTDLDDMSYLKKLSEENSLSLINTRAFQTNNVFSSNLTIGSGTRANGSTITTRIVETNEDTKNIYKLRNNADLPEGQYVNIDIAALQELNKKNNYRPYIGALADSLKEKGVNIYTFGNSNIFERAISFSGLITMDSKGIISDGIIDERANILSSKKPFGMTTNYEMMYTEIEPIDNGLIVLELGDLYRLDKYKGYLSNDAYDVSRSETLTEIDEFIKDIHKLKGSDMDMIIVSPTVSTVAYKKGERLAPIVYIDSELQKSGVLVSSTTRREGIISNLDIAPFIADHFESDKGNFVGRSYDLLPSQDNYEFVRKLNTYTAFIYMNRSEVLSVFAIYEILIVLFTFVILQFKNRGKGSTNIVYRFLILSNIAIPIALLLMPAFWPDTLFKAITLLVLITGVLTSIAIAFKRERIDGVILLTGFCCILLSVDIVTGSNLIKNGFLGYDPIIGARYYGIGNEYMGILIGCTLVFSTAILDRFKISKWTVAIIYVLIVIVIGYPGFGANVGGSITAVFAFLFVIFKLFNGRLRPKHFIILILSVPLFIGCLAVIDLFLVKSTSHLGNAVNQIRSGGIDVIVSIIIRKVTMNIRLFNVSIWSKVLVISLGVLGLLFYRPFGVAKQVFIKYKNLKVGLLGLLVACLVTFVVNDSGVVAAATAVIPLVMTLLYLVFVEIRDL